MQRILPICLIFFLLILAACALPKPVDPAILTETFLASLPTETPTATPSATQTPLPSATFTSTPTFGPTPTPTLGPEFFHGSLRYEVAFVSQEGLRYQGKPISTGCTAAALQMVLEFWHAYKEEYPLMSAQELIDANVRQGTFRPESGLNITDTEDDLARLGYYLGTRTDSGKDELLTALERYGPLLILTKVEWTPFGANHMAVVTAYDPETDIIRVMDPWQEGGIMEFEYESFDGIWGLNYYEDPTEELRRCFFFVVPYAELRGAGEPFIPDFVLKEIKAQEEAPKEGK